MLPVLAKVDPCQIVIDPSLLKPTDWDSKVVIADLIAYVESARLIKATPVLRCIGGALVAVSGEPFVTAAREVSPPLKEVVCLIECPEELIQSPAFKIVTAAEMLEEHPAGETYDAIEMLAFTRSLIDIERAAVESAIVGFFNEVSANATSYGGNYSSMSSFDWGHQWRTLKWIWRRSDEIGSHAFMFQNMLANLDSNTAPLSSWNGLAVQIEK